MSWQNQGGGGGTGFHDQPAVVDGISKKTHASCRDKSSLLKTGPIVHYTIRNRTPVNMSPLKRSTKDRIHQAISVVREPVQLLTKKALAPWQTPLVGLLMSLQEVILSIPSML